MKTGREKSNITVTVPDISAPLAQALEAFNKEQLAKGELPASELNFTEFGYVLTKEGMFVLSKEGVGESEPITPDNKVEVGLYPEWDKGNGTKSFSPLPMAYFNFSDTELIMLPTLKELPLEDFIRRFGPRLESNYHIWLASLRESEPMTIESST